MYMVVFAMIIIGILGYFSQMFTTQSAESRRAQPGIANIVLAWHSAAMGTARNAVDTEIMALPCHIGFDVGSDGKFNGKVFVCSTTAPTFNAATDSCTQVKYVAEPPPDAPPDPETTPSDKIELRELVMKKRPCVFPLSLDTKIDPYKFQSVFFTPDGGDTNYLATYVEPPAVDRYNNRFICLDGSVNCAPGQQVPYDFYRLYNEMSKSKYATRYAFGIAKGGKLTTIHSNLEDALSCDPDTNECKDVSNKIIEYSLSGSASEGTIKEGSFVIISPTSSCNYNSYNHKLDKEERVPCECQYPNCF